ncbi:MAG: InlB B-repeat-containing protein [Bifidobacterium adolescentis]|nr:InlB B-repeat-containing protein [Bifidobacterium adolescentis]
MALSENNGTGGNVGNWRVRGHSKITAQDNGSATIKTTSSIESFGGYWYSGLNIHAGACVNGQWAGVDKTGVNVGANSTVELVSKTLKVSKTRNWQSIDCIADVRVNGYAGGFSQVHVAVDVPPKPSHTVSYNANGGSGAPGSATKWYGEDFYISNQKPTRANHVFQYWATAANGSGTRYNPGQRYLPDANVILYAVWKLATKPPTIQSFTAQRVDEAGVPDSNGTMVRFTAQWRVDTTGDSANACTSLRFGYKNANGAWTDYDPVVNDGTSGTTTIDAGPFSTGASHQLRVTLSDKYTTVSSVTTVGPARFVIDVSPDGRGIGIGVEAPDDGVSIYGKPIRMDDGEAGIEITGTDGSSIYVGARGININNPRYGHMRLDDNGLNIHNDQGWGLSISAGGWNLTWAGNHTLATGPKAGALYIDGKEIKTV